MSLRKVNFDFHWPRWENVWRTVGLAAALVAGTLLLNVVTATHKVNHYYIGGSSYGTACVYAQVDWDEDPKIFCSDDIGKVLLVADGANKVLQGR